MEAEWEALPDDYDQATSGHMEMATLLKQSILLIGQTFNAITPQLVKYYEHITSNRCIKGNFERT